MPQLADQGLVLRAVEVAHCPVFRPGDLVLACGREVFTPGGACCARLLAQFLPSFEAMEKREELTALAEGVWNCRGEGCEARFEVRLCPLEEFARLRGPPPSPPPPLVAASAIPVNTGGTMLLRRNAVVEAGDSRKKMPFVSQLPSGMARTLLASGQRRIYEVGEVILREGEVGTGVFFLLAGEVAVVKRSPDGAEVELARLGAGEVFGEMSFLSGDPVNATIRTLQPTRVVAIEDALFDHLMTENPILHRWFSRLFAERLRAGNVRLEERLACGMTGRLSMINLLEVLQTLNLSRQTGLLRISRGAAVARLYLAQGQVRQVVEGDRSGEEAFYGVARWTEGTFSFVKEEHPELVPNVLRETMSLLMEAARQADEKQS